MNERWIPDEYVHLLENAFLNYGVIIAAFLASMWIKKKFPHNTCVMDEKEAKKFVKKHTKK